MFNAYRLLCVFTLLLPGGYTLAQKPVLSLQSTVTGNQEQPKVLYILPWQKADTIKVDYQPIQGVVNEVFTPLDREEFLREMHYRKQFNSSETQEN